MTMPKFESVAQNHILYKTYDTDAPEAIKDRNGYVALGLCKICGKGEAELDEPCVPLYTADQLTEAHEAGKRDAIPQWQPIETAPKDVFLLLYCPRIGIVRGHWNADKHSKKPSPYWTHDRERLYGIRETRYDQPTHWMPLPAAPKGEE